MASQGVSEEAKQHWRNGNALFEENKYAEAVAEFSLAIKTDPEYSDAYFNRGLSERLLQDFEASKQDFEHVLALEQNSPDAMVLLGDISEEMGNMLEAKQWYEKALIAKPDYAEAKTRLDKVNEILSGKAVVPPGSAAANVDVGGETVIEEGQIKKVAFYKSNMRFDSVIGMNKTKKYLTDNIILAMQHPELFKKYGKKQGLGLILYGPPGTGKCVAKGTLVPTMHGLFPIEQLHMGREEDTAYALEMPIESIDGVRRTSHFYYGGRKKTLKITTEHGFEIEGTLVHPILVLDSDGNISWKKLGDIKKGDCAIVPNKINLQGVDTEVDEDTAYLMGLLTGDGHIASHSKIVLSNKEKDIISFFESYLNKRGIELHHSKSRKYDHYINNKDFADNMHSLGIAAVPSYQKRVPHAVMRAKPEIVRAFLSGLFDTDATGISKVRNIEYATTSKELAKEVQMLLLSFGVFSTITRHRSFYTYKGIRKAVRNAYRVFLGQHDTRLFAERIGFRSLAKKKTYENLKEGMEGPSIKRDFVPAQVLKKLGAKLKDKRYSEGKRNTSYEMLARLIKGLEIDKDLAWIMETKPHFSRISGIEESENEVFDLSVPDSHSFIANGLVAHNTFIVNAISGESGANVIIARINQIIDMYSGNTEKNLHAIFEQARQNPPCIIFFDELDALGVKRGGGGEGAGGSAMRLAVNQFLVEMNGLESNPGGIFVIGATNNPWDIDPALKRSGRFGDRIYISPPDYASRKSLFDFYTKHTPRQNLDFDRLARATMGFSGADIAALCDKAIMTPLLHEFESKKERKLSTKDLLDILKDKDTGGSSLDEWYFMVKKEVISTTETQIVNGKKQVTVKEGKLSAEEKVLYKTMVNDIKKNTNPFIIFIKKFMRFFALYIF